MKKTTIIILCTFLIGACDKADFEQVKPELTDFVDFTDINLSSEDIALLNANAKSGLTKVPGGPVPFWARVGSEIPKGIPHTDEYGIIYFYCQNTGEVNPVFNLLQFFDGAALGSETSCEGSEWYKPGYFFPYMTKLKGKGTVPFWIITSEQVNEVFSDGVITIVELSSLNPAPAKGYANRFTENLWVTGGGAPIPGLIAIAEGIIEEGSGDIVDGQKFTFKLHTKMFDPAEPLYISVKFKLF
jgi:hypothetical protein